MRKTHGFTIVELIVVISVIGILAGIVIISYNSVRGKARDAQRLHDIDAIQKGVELYKTFAGSYPAVNSTPNASGWETSTNGTSATNFLAVLKTSGQMDTILVDPTNTGNPTNLNPGTSTDNFEYFYYLYPAGSYGCDANRGAYYVIGISRMENIPKGQNAPKSPGFSCSGRDWASQGAWVTGQYSN